MTTPPKSPVPEGKPSEDEDDHDLLTYGIAGDRLRVEIAAEETRLSEATAQHGEGSEQARRSVARLDQLREGLRRQEHARLNEINEKQFFGEHFESSPPAT